MAETPNAAPAAEAPVDIVKMPAGGDTPESVRNAARALSQWRNRPAEPPAQPNSQEPRAVEPAPPAPESADAADANPPAEDHGEIADSEAGSQEPPIAPPTSWTTDEKERWQSLPRETQEYIAQREQERERLLTRSQTEAKEQQRTFDAERQKLEQARTQYEQALPQLAGMLQASIAGEFADIKNSDDVERLAREDWARYLAWDARQKKLASVMTELQAAQQRQSEEVQAKFAQFAAEQDARFIKRVPEFADKDKAAQLQKVAVEVLRDVGFTEDELAKHWSGQQVLSLRDGRLQELIADAVRYRQAKMSAAKPVAKNLPPVRRPGVAPAPNQGVMGEIKQIEKQMQTARGNASIKLAARLQQLYRQAGQ
jgi:hypothetical protein